MEGCDLYQRMKNRTEEVIGKLKLSEVPKKPWSYLTVDFITKLPIVIRRKCGQTLGLGLRQRQDIVVVILLVYDERKRGHMTGKSHDIML